MAASTRLDTFNNSWYQPGPRWKVIFWFLCNSIFINSYLPIPVSLKIWVLRCFGAKIGKGVMIKPAINIKYPWFLSIGDYSWIGETAWIDNFTSVNIGSHVCISQGAYLLTGNHDYKKSTFDHMISPIVIEDGAWIGAKSVVGPGVTVKTHAVLAVGSVASSELEPYTIYRGNPATIVRKRVLEN
jgi:putative colanic acid biosynthesis acetyltransferase WcaF